MLCLKQKLFQGKIFLIINKSPHTSTEVFIESVIDFFLYLIEVFSQSGHSSKHRYDFTVHKQFYE